MTVALPRHGSNSCQTYFRVSTYLSVLHGMYVHIEKVCMCRYTYTYIYIYIYIYIYVCMDLVNPQYINLYTYIHTYIHIYIYIYIYIGAWALWFRGASCLKDTAGVSG